MSENEGLEALRLRIRDKRDERGEGRGKGGRKSAGLIKQKCEGCGDSFDVKDTISGRKKKYCSPECAFKNRPHHRGHVYQIENGRRVRKDKTEIPVGTKRGDKDGYVHIFDGERWSVEHRAVMEKYLERELVKGEVVHHKNGIKNDNRLENLELMVQMKHSSAVDAIHKRDLPRLMQRIKDLYDQLEENGIRVKSIEERICDALEMMVWKSELKNGRKHDHTRDL